jgi:predicted acylesterase/phospholipase RssA
MQAKKYSIALGWWASRWFVHIWVLKYLEEKNIEIVELSGTSMWAIIASLIAIWKNSNEIIEIAKSINFLKLIDFDLSFWVLKWKKVLKKLEEIFWEIKIEETKIRLKIVATSIETWKKEVFTSWKLTEALRASISLPWIFIPHKYREKYFVDWWIIDNLPIDVLEWENIIWISALKNIGEQALVFKKKFLGFEINTNFFEYNYQILHRAILLMMRQNEEKSIKSTKWKRIIIQPNFWELDYYNFDKLDKFVELGYNEAKKKLKLIL